MRAQIIFENGKLSVHITAESDSERLILGALNGPGGDNDIQGSVHAESRAHYTHGKFDSVRIVLTKRSDE